MAELDLACDGEPGPRPSDGSPARCDPPEVIHAEWERRRRMSLAERIAEERERG